VWPEVLTNMAIHRRLGKLLIPPTTVINVNKNPIAKNFLYCKNSVFALYLLPLKKE